MFTNPFTSLFTRRKTATRPARRRAATFRPRVEGLEDRAVPSITSVNFDNVNNVVTIQGNDAADTVVLSDPGTGGVTLTASGYGTVIAPPQYRTFKVQTNGGND